MQNYSPEQLDEIFQTLPEELKEAIVSVDTAKVINETGKKYGLHIDQIGKVASETGLVLLGLTHPTEFVSNLTKTLGIERVVVSQVASDLNDKIFLKVRELIRGIQEKPTREEVKEGEPRPLRDSLLRAIENPEELGKNGRGKTLDKKEIPFVEIKNPYEPVKPEPGKDVPLVAPVPSQALSGGPPQSQSNVPGAPTTEAEIDILEKKLGGQFNMIKTESTVAGETIKTDKKSDPYREQI